MEEPVRSIETTNTESYASAVAIALNAVPHVGGVLSGIANAFITKRQNKRLCEFLVALADNLTQLESRLNMEFMRSEEFEDLCEDIFSKASETRQQDKLEALRTVLLNTVLSDHPKYETVAEIVELLHGWQARHVIVLRLLADPLGADREMGSPVGEGGSVSTSIGAILQKLLPEWDEDQIDRTWSDLYDNRIHNTPGTKTMMTDKGIHQLQNRLTDFGGKVASFIADPMVVTAQPK